MNMPCRTTLTLTDMEAAERFRDYRDENAMSTDDAVRKLLENAD